jgi:hypothetical protein
MPTSLFQMHLKTVIFDLFLQFIEYWGIFNPQVQLPLSIKVLSPLAGPILNLGA